MSKMIRGISKNARFFIVDTKDVVQEAMRVHKTSPTATDAFGRLLTAGLIMGASLKGEDLLTIKIDSDGPVNKMVVTADAKGEIKGYMSNPEIDVPFTDNGKSDVPSLLGKGVMHFIKDMGLKDPYVGISPLNYGGIAEDIAYYYYTSEQIPTVLALGVRLKDENTVDVAGGYMIQLLPNADDNFIDTLEKKVSAIKPMTDLLKGGLSLEDIAKLLYDDMDTEDDIPVEEYEILETSEVSYTCNCNKGKFLKALASLGKDTLIEILEEDKTIKTECQFCDKTYEFNEEDLKEVIGE